MNALAVRILAAVALILTVMTKAHVSLPAAVLAVAAVCAACLLLAVLIATGIGRLAESAPRYRTAAAWRAA